MKIGKRARFVALALVATFLILWAALWGLVSSKLNKEVFESRLSESLGVTLKITRLHLDWRGRIELEGVDLSTPKGLPLGHLVEAVADVERAALLGGHLSITALRLKHLDLQLSREILAELDHPRPQTAPATPRTYPIELEDSSLEWKDGASPGLTFGPIRASSPAPSQIGLQLGEHTLLNVTRGPEGSAFSLDTSAGDGLPKAWVAALGSDDRLHLQGRYEQGKLQIDGTAARAGLEIPLHASWNSEHPDIVDFSSLEGLALRLTRAPKRVDFALLPGHLGEVAWEGKGCLDWTGAPEAQVTVTLTKGARKLTAASQLRRPVGTTQLQLLTQLDLEQPGTRVPHLRLESRCDGDDAGVKGDFQVLSGRSALASGKIDWNATDGFKAGWSAFFKPELLGGVPLEGALTGEVSKVASKAWQIDIHGPKLSLVYQPILSLEGSFHPRLGDGEATFHVGSVSSAPVKFKMGAGTLDLAGQSISVQGPGFTNQLDLHLTGTTAEGFTRIEATHIKIGSLPPISTIWARAGAQWTCSSLQIGDSKMTPRLAFDAVGNALKGTWKIPPTDLARPGGALHLQGKFSGVATFKDHKAQFKGRIQGFTGPAWHCPNLILTGSLRPKGEGWGYSLLASEGQFRLPAATGLSGPGSLRLEASSEGGRAPALEIKIAALTARGANLGPASLTATLAAFQPDAKNPVFVQLSMPRLAARIEGGVGQEIAMGGGFEGTDLAAITPFLKGHLRGGIQINGKLDAPKLAFNGYVEGGAAGTRRLGRFPLTFNYDGSARQAVLEVPNYPAGMLARGMGGGLRVAYEAKGGRGEFKVTSKDLTWQGRRLPTLDVSSPDLKKVAILLQPSSGVGWRIDGTVAPRVHLATRLDKLDISLLGAAFDSPPDVRGTLSGEGLLESRGTGYTVTFRGRGEDLTHPASRIGSAKIDLETHLEGKSLKQMRLDVGEISANQIGALGTRYPGLEGQIALHVAGSPADLVGEAGLKSARWKGEAFPALSARFRMRGKTFSLEPLELGVTPPLRLTGESSGGNLHFKAVLKGQSLADLLRVAGSSNRDIQGRISGRVEVQGTLAHPRVQFHGALADLVYAGNPIGTARLEVQAEDKLSGSLAFPHAVDAAAFGKTGGIRGLIKVAGATLGGTPSSPKVEPVLQIH